MDVAAALFYTDAQAMTRKLDEDEIQNRQIVGSGNRGATVINESGLYLAILRSRKAEAKRFKKWVTAEVLPAIRKRGRYEDAGNKLGTLVGQTIGTDGFHCLAAVLDEKVRHLPAPARQFIGSYALEGEWMPAEDGAAGQALNDLFAWLTEQVAQPNVLLMPLVNAVMEKMGGLPPMPEAQWREIDTRLRRLGSLFHPFSDQAGDVVGIGRALRGLNPVAGIRREGFKVLARR